MYEHVFSSLFGVADAAVWVDFRVSVCHRVFEIVLVGYGQDEASRVKFLILQYGPFLFKLISA